MSKMKDQTNYLIDGFGYEIMKNEAKALNPLSADRGVLTTSPEIIEQVTFDDLLANKYNGMICSIDYLEFTVWDQTVQSVIQFILNLSVEDFVDLERGGGGYPSMWRANFGDIRVLHGATNPEVMGIHVTIPGDGCRALFARVLPSQLLLNLQEFKTKVTRIDLALDNFDDIHYYPHELEDYMKLGLISSKWRTLSPYRSQCMSTGEILSDTVYLGSTQSDLFCRVYDKKLEQNNKIKDADRHITREWVRWEMVFKRDRAQAVYTEIITNGFMLGQVFAGVLRNSFNILTPSLTDSNKARWGLDIYWENFIGEIEPIRLYRVIKERTIETVKDWLQRQVMPSLCAVMKAEDSMVWIAKEIFANESRMSKQLRELVIEYKTCHMKVV